MAEQYQCSETGRTFPSADEARASEARFREIQTQCSGGRVPDLRPGDVIYLEGARYISHGCDDFCGGLAEVSEVSQGKSKGQVSRVRVIQQPGSMYDWNRLAAEQPNLRREYGTKWAHPDPDNRPEFNGYWL